ncbi:MAG: acetolactate synthase small subunit [Saprospiraceae bacterium]|nr:acetolactate synthase small subunit [Saprospiraceae bacterium]MBK8668301.1 acetolactate synthase small subunit [Saprospiraceae bacterium]MBL0099213.1 acetolactate synthase small subunit [Saprospiraceae bacterium]
MQEYTLTVFSEDKTGILNRIVTVITRRHFDIKSITVSPSSMEGIYRFTIMLVLEEDQIRKLTEQIDKQIDVLKAFYYDNSQIIYQEIALYKVSTEAFYGSDTVENLIRNHNARILSIEKEYIVIEKTGHQEETEALLNELKVVGIYEFVRSGRVAIVKPMERLKNYLKSIEG